MSLGLIPPGVSSVLKSVLDPVTVVKHTVTRVYDGDTVSTASVPGTSLKPKLKVAKPKAVSKVVKPKPKVLKRKLQTSFILKLANGAILRPGDQISRVFGALRLAHHAIYVGLINPSTLLPPVGNQIGKPYVVEMLDTGGVQLSPLRQSKFNWKVVANGASATVTRAFKMLGPAKYNVIWRNCETIANYIRTGIPLSFQVVRMAGGIIMLVGAAAAAAYMFSRGRNPGRTDQRKPPVPELPNLGGELVPSQKTISPLPPPRQDHPLIPSVSVPTIPSSRKRPRQDSLAGRGGSFFLEKKKKHGFELF